MLNEVIAPAAIGAGMVDHFQHGVDLVEAREDQRFFAVRLVEVDEPTDYVEHDVSGEDCATFRLIGP